MTPRFSIWLEQERCCLSLKEESQKQVLGGVFWGKMRRTDMMTLVSYFFSLWCLQAFGRICLKDLRVGSWQFESRETVSQCPEQEWLCSAWFANITGNTGRRVFRKYLWAGINSRGCSSKSKVHPFLIHLPNQSVRAPVPTKMEGEVLECRRKKQRGRRLFGDNRSQLRKKIVLPPSLQSAQAHQLNNAYHLVSQLESFS